MSLLTLFVPSSKMPLPKSVVLSAADAPSSIALADDRLSGIMKFATSSVECPQHLLFKISR